MLTRILPNNEGTIDRAARVVLGLAALSTVFVGPHSNWGLLGLIPLATGLIGSCPIYTAFGINTGAKK